MTILNMKPQRLSSILLSNDQKNNHILRRSQKKKFKKKRKFRMCHHNQKLISQTISIRLSDTMNKLCRARAWTQLMWLTHFWKWWRVSSSTGLQTPKRQENCSKLFFRIHLNFNITSQMKNGWVFSKKNLRSLMLKISLKKFISPRKKWNALRG